ncbi:MAG: hypothetical protein RSA49_03325 [Anaerovoracaceae bacterium]
MALDKLLEIIDIEQPTEFQFFENFADLMETEYIFSVDDCYELFREVNREEVIDIINNYFEELLDGIPDDKTDFYTLLDTIKLSLMGLLKAEDDQASLVHFSEELTRFKDWYSKDSKVILKKIDTLEEVTVSIRDAVVTSRLEALNGEKYHYDFDECLEYELDEFILSYGDLAAQSDYDNGDNSDLIDNGYVYDDEMRNN